MPATVIDFTPRAIGEKIIFSLDFQLNLAPGETPASAIWTLSLVSGQDANVSQRCPATGGGITGTVVSSPIVDLKTLGGIVSGSRYLIQASVITSLGQNIIGWSHFNVFQAV